MGNKHEGETSFEALGSVYTLRLTARAVASIETDMGAPIGRILPDIEVGYVKAIAALLRYGIADLPKGREYDIIDAVGIPNLGDPIGEAMQRAGLFQGAVEGDENEGKPKATGG